MHRLVYEDLQYSVLYWLGEIYFKFGYYEKCFKVWKSYSENIERAFDSSPKKAMKIQEFVNKFYVLCNSINQFKKNIFVFKNFCLPEDDFALFKKKNRFEDNYEASSDLRNFLTDFDKIQEFRPNIEANFVEFYEYHRGLIHFYIDSKSLVCILVYLTFLSNIIIAGQSANQIQLFWQDFKLIA